MKLYASLLRWNALLLSTVLIMILSIGCSGSPGITSNPTEDIDIRESGDDSSGRYLMGYYHCSMASDGTIEVTMDRSAWIHFDVTPFVTPPNCSDCMTVKMLEFKPAMGYMIVAVTLRNPTPISGMDVRGILMSDNDPPHDILNRDGYTDQWDNGGPVSRNPFKRYFPDEPFPGGTSATEVLQVALPTPLNFQFDVAVDASWPGPCKEPYDLRGYVTKQNLQGDMEIVAYASDHQDDVSLVVADTTDATGGTTNLLFDSASNTWRGDFENTLGLPDGRWTMWVWAESLNSGNKKVYQKFEYFIGTPLGLSDGWPNERGGNAGTGRSAVNGPSNGGLKWSHAFPGVTYDESLLVTPVVDTSGNTYVPLPDSLTAIDIIGSEKWTFNPGNVTGSFSPILKQVNKILWPVNRTLLGYELGFIYTLRNDGTQALIPYLLSETVSSSGTVTEDGHFLLPSGDGISLNSPTGYRIWKYVPGGGGFNVPRPPAIDTDGNIYFVSNHSGPNAEIISLNADMSERWTSPLNGLPLSQPGLGDTGELYAASTAYDLGQLDKFGIQARNAGNGTGIWAATHSNFMGLTSFGIAVTSDGKIIATGSNDALIYAVDASDGTFISGVYPFGVLLTNLSAPSIDASGQIYSGGEIKVSNLTYSIFNCLDASLGIVWTVQQEGHGYVGSPVIGSNGYVMCMSVASNDTLELHCFGEM